MSNPSKEGEMSRRKALVILGKATVVLAAGGVMVTGGVDQFISSEREIRVINEKLEETNPLIPPEELKAAKKVIVVFQQDAVLTAKRSIKNRGDVVEVALRDPRGLANAFAVSDKEIAREQEIQRLTDVYDSINVRRVSGILVVAFGMMTGFFGFVRLQGFLKRSDSPTTTPPDAPLPAPTTPAKS